MKEADSPQDYIAQVEAEGGCAFPAVFMLPKGKKYQHPGMTLRDWIAISSVPALFAESYASSIRNRTTFDVFGAVSSAAYEFADAMLAERAK